MQIQQQEQIVPEVVPQSSDLTDIQFGVLRDAVNLARNVPTNSLETLKFRLRALGHDEEDITAAVMFWANYEVEKIRKTDR